MTFAITPVSRAFQTYRTQERIAELNRQAKLNTVQTQRDRVDISTKARELLEKKNVPAFSLSFSQSTGAPPATAASLQDSGPPPAEEDFTPLVPDQ